MNSSGDSAQPPHPQQPGAAPTGGKSPGKGAKSLELMQQRMKSAATEAESQTPQPVAQSLMTAPMVTTAAEGKPKGKDFSAMSQRQQADHERAASLQNEARIAAGMPPLERPTATMVSIPTVAPAAAPKSTQQTPTPRPSEARLTQLVPLVGPKVNDVVKSIDPNYTLEPQAQEQLLQLLDDFTDKVVQQSIRIAQHRGSKTLDVQDVQLILEKQWGIVVPGLGPAARGVKRSASGNASVDVAPKKSA